MTPLEFRPALPRYGRNPTHAEVVLYCNGKRPKLSRVESSRADSRQNQVIKILQQRRSSCELVDIASNEQAPKTQRSQEIETRDCQNIFNTSLSQAKVPSYFKTATITPVPKRKHITSLNNYQPVALTPIMMKCFERLVKDHIIAPNSSPTFDPLQFAYRGCHLLRSSPEPDTPGGEEHAHDPNATQLATGILKLEQSLKKFGTNTLHRLADPAELTHRGVKERDAGKRAHAGGESSDQKLAGRKLRRRESDPLVHQGELQHMAAELGSYKQAHTSSPPLTLGNSRVVEGPAPLKELGSRAQAMRGVLFTSSMGSIVLTYTKITVVCLTSRNKSLNSKALKTCSTHLVVYLIMLGPGWRLTRLTRCRRVIINPFCDNASLFKISCQNLLINHIYGLGSAMVIMGSPLGSVALTLLRIAMVCLSTKNKALNSKALQTCATHLAMYLIMLVASFTPIIMHRHPEWAGNEKVVSILFHVIPPTLNPIIYGLQCNELRQKI
ncbi:hypothetical protein L3Q82_006636 [Scortum barcoo]|uniref:Uncharacterized protein n=1 Tax=Scortum barcoo TaxID=214431 RepID=A0ACB8WZY1_9TELE|nr:hypothetical protein L3Q82_006636 [Scortum barcoo]